MVSAMDKDEKRRLKKLGKQVTAERSRELQERLAEANPAPIGSDSWMRSFREGTLKERALRTAPPDQISAANVRADYVPNPMHQSFPPELFGLPGSFWECLECGDAVHSLPSATTSCQCGNITIDIGEPRRLFHKPEGVRLVTLIGKA